MISEMQEIRRRLAAAGAALFFMSMPTGIWVALALTGKVVVNEPHLALAAHMNALLGGLWLLVAAWSLEFMRYGPVGLKRLALGLGITAWSNWLVTLLASFLGVKGVELQGNLRNDTVFVLLTALVVIPGILSTVFWVFGFVRRKG